MKEKTTKATGYHYKPMPTLYHDEQAERRARHHIEELTAAINEYVEKFRSNGVTIDTEDELRLLTPEVVREQIQATRQRRLGERFLPASIRQAEEREFNRMERTLAPLAEELQETLKNIPFPIHVGGKDNTYLSGDEVEEYIEKASTVEIPLICARGVLTTTLRHPRKRFYKVLPKAERVPSFLHIFKAACSR